MTNPSPANRSCSPQRQRIPHPAVTIRVAGQDDDLQPARDGREGLHDAFLPYGVGVHENVIKDQDLRFGDREFLGDRNPEAKEQLLPGTLGKQFEGMGLLATPAHAGDAKRFIKEHPAVWRTGEFGECRAQPLFQRCEDGLRRGLLAVFDKIVSDPGRPGHGLRRPVPLADFGLPFDEFGFTRVEALSAQCFEGTLRFRLFGAFGPQFVCDLLQRRRRPLVPVRQFCEVWRQLRPRPIEAGFSFVKHGLRLQFRDIDPRKVAIPEVGDLGLQRALAGLALG